MYMNYNPNDQVRLVNNECFGIFFTNFIWLFFHVFSSAIAVKLTAYEILTVMPEIFRVVG